MPRVGVKFTKKSQEAINYLIFFFLMGHLRTTPRPAQIFVKIRSFIMRVGPELLRIHSNRPRTRTASKKRSSARRLFTTNRVSGVSAIIFSQINNNPGAAGDRILYIIIMFFSSETVKTPKYRNNIMIVKVQPLVS